MRYFLTYIFVALATMPAIAQQNDLNKQVEVTKDYTPDVEQAAKLTPEPRMIDTVALRPHGEYVISPMPWGTSFGVPAFAPIKINTTMSTLDEPFYLKIGGGYPLNSLLDFYAWSTGARGSIGGYINHMGEFGNLVNDMAREVSATQSSNSVGIMGERAVGRRMSLKADVGYDYDFVTKYGDFDLSQYPLTPAAERHDPARQSYSTVSAKVVLGDEFKDFSHFNFRVGAGGYYFSDRHNNTESNMSAFVELGKQFGVHRITLKGGFDGYFGGDSLHYYDRVLTVSPRYEIEMSRFKFSIGGDYVHDTHNGRIRSYFFPNFAMRLDVTTGYFVPFIDVDGALMNNGYRSTVEQNPYVVAGLTADNSAVYNGRAGITGSFASSFSYKAYAGLTVFRGLNNFANLYGQNLSSEFVYLNDNATLFTIGGDLSGRIAGSFLLSASAHYYGYTLKNLEKAGARPNFDASLNVRYNYREKFSVRAEATFIGSRYFYEFVNSELAANPNDVYVMNKVSPVVDLSIAADYKVSKLIGVFLEGSNLLNARLYPYNHYRGFGISCTAGVKLTF